MDEQAEALNSEDEIRIANALCQDLKVLEFVRGLAGKALLYLDLRASVDLPGDDAGQCKAVDAALVHLSRFVADEMTDHMAGRVGHDADTLRRVFKGEGNLRETMNHLLKFAARVLLPDMVGPARRKDFWSLFGKAGFDVEGGKALVVDSSCGCLGVLATARLSLEDMRATMDPEKIRCQKWSSEYKEQEASSKIVCNADAPEAMSRVSRTRFCELGGSFQGVSEADLASPLGMDFCPWMEEARTVKLMGPESSSWIAAAIQARVPLLGGRSVKASFYMQLFAAMAGDRVHTVLLGTLACLGYLVPIRSHSLHEVLLACKSTGRLRYDLSVYRRALTSPKSLTIDQIPPVNIPAQIPPATIVKSDTTANIFEFVSNVDPSWWLWFFRRAICFLKTMPAWELLEGDASSEFDLTHIDDQLRKKLGRCVHRCNHEGNGCECLRKPGFLIVHSWTATPLDWSELSGVPYPEVKDRSLKSLCEQVAFQEKGDRTCWGSVDVMWDDLCLDSPDVDITPIEYLYLCRGLHVILSPNAFHRLWVVLELVSALACPNLDNLYLGARPFMLAAHEPKKMNALYARNIQEFALNSMCVQNKLQSTSILGDFVRTTFVDEASFHRFFKIGTVVYIIRDWCLSEPATGCEEPFDLGVWADVARTLSPILVDAIERLTPGAPPGSDDWFSIIARPLLVSEQQRALIMLQDTARVPGTCDEAPAKKQRI